MKIIKENPCKWKLKVLTDKGKKRFADYEHDCVYTYDAKTKSYDRKDPQEVDNFVFEATLNPDGFYRGRSAAGFHFLDEEGTQYTMRIAKVEEMLQAAVEGKVKVIKDKGFKGTFTFFKQGANYSVGLYTK